MWYEKKNDNDVFIFILDPNGAQIERSSWWEKYLENLNKISAPPYIQYTSKADKVKNIFNTQIGETVKTETQKRYPMINCTYDNQINLKPHNINFSGSNYQQGGYCAMITFFFIHI